MFEFLRRKKERPTDGDKDCILVWTGPRATDIIDCENNLFDGSITLYGFERPDSSTGDSSEVAYFDDFFDRIRGTDGECRGSEQEWGLNREDSEGVYYVPNHCFCDSNFNLGGKGFVINHNRSDLEEGDLFILAEQVLLMARSKDCDVYFMSYNQNYVGRHGSEEQYLLLASILACNDLKNRDEFLNTINGLYGLRKRGPYVSRGECKSFVESLEKLVTDFNHETGTSDDENEIPGGGSETYDGYSNHSVEPSLKGNGMGRYNSTHLKDFIARHENDQEWPVDELLEISCDVLCHAIKVKKFLDNGVVDDPIRRGFVDNIRRDWIDSLTVERICKMSLLTSSLRLVKIDGEDYLSRLKESLMSLVERHLDSLGEDMETKHDGEVNLVWLMKYLSEIIVSHMVCLNKNEYLMDLLDSKDRFRHFCRKHEIPTTENIVVQENGEDCSLNVFKSYIDCNKFVIQKNHSSGGFGTFLYERPTQLGGNGGTPIPGSIDYTLSSPGSPGESIDDRIRTDLKGCTKGDLILSEYRDSSISVNVHCFISEREILYSPGSVQIVINIDGRLMYSGADFVAFEQFRKDNPGQFERIQEYLAWMCSSLRGYGYRGVIGFDIICSAEHGVEFVEGNNRFQASTCLLNKRLRNFMFECESNGHIHRRYDGKPISNNYRCPSTQLLNLMCFSEADVYGFDGEDPNHLHERESRFGRMKLRYAERFCNECVGDHDDIIRLPMLSSELENMNVPFSMFIFYNSGPFKEDEATTVAGREHYRTFCESMDELNRYERDAYQERLWNVNHEVVSKVGAFLHENKHAYEKNDNGLLASLPLKSSLLNDGITNRYYQDAFKGFREIEGALMNSRSSPGTLAKCRDVLGILPSMMYSEFSSTCDQLCILCDCVQYYQDRVSRIPASEEVSMDLFVDGQIEHWRSHYKRRLEFLRGKLEATNSELLESPPKPHPRKEDVTSLREEYRLSIADMLPISPLEIEASYVLGSLRLPSDVLSRRMETIRVLMEKLSVFPRKWISRMGSDFHADETKANTHNINEFSKSLDDVMAMMILMEIQLIHISMQDVNKLCKSIRENFVKSMRKGLKDILTTEGIGTQNDSAKRSRKSVNGKNNEDRFNQSVFPEAYDIIVRNSVFKNELCTVFKGEPNDSGGGDQGKRYDPDAFLSKVLFFTNLSSTNLGKVVLHPNIIPPDSRWNRRILCPDGAEYLALKIGLINNGIRLDDNIKERFKARPGVNSSIDLLIRCREYDYRGVLPGSDRESVKKRELPINCAYNNKIAVFSPYKLVEECKDGSGKAVFTIKYYGRPIKVALSDNEVSDLEVGFYHQKDDVKGLTENNRVPKSSIAFLATDRVRFQHSDGCTFASNGRGCKFCEFTVRKSDPRKTSFGEKDIMEVVEYMMRNREGHHDYRYVWSYSDYDVPAKPKLSFDHVLIGGGTMSGDSHHIRDRIARMSKKIVDESGVRPNIYLMCVPPDDLEDLRVWKESGVTEIAFNMEVFSRLVAKKIMPGKGRISRSTYMSSLIRATHIWKTPGAVRSAMIIGLEKENSTIDGISLLTTLGVEPILSIFRPVEGTELEYVMPLSSPIVHDIYVAAQKLCVSASLRLGPDCIDCQNNTLSLPEGLDMKIVGPSKEPLNADGSTHEEGGMKDE